MKLRGESNPEHIEIRNAILAALTPFEKEHGSERLLAILAYTVGQFAAMMPAESYTPEALQSLIMTNIINGNQYTLNEIINNAGGLQ